MATAPKFRIDVDIHSLLMDSSREPVKPAAAKGYDWGNIDKHKFDDGQLAGMKETCQQHCFSTLNHNLAYC